MKVKTQVALGTAALLAGAAVLFSAPQKSDLHSNRSSVAFDSTAKNSVVQKTLSDAVSTPEYSNSIPSLRGMNHGVRLLSRHGSGDSNDDIELIVTAALRDLFDFYLSAAGEESHVQLVARIQAELERQLSGSALKQALEILSNYLDYKTALAAFNEKYPASKVATDEEKVVFLSKRQVALNALQDEILGRKVAGIFFEFDRQLDEHTLSKAKILLSDMSDSGKQQALINLNAQLPFDAFQHQQRNQQQHDLMAIEGREALSDQQKYQQRSEIVGEAAANRLAELDRERAQWQNRLNTFQQEVNRLKAAEMAKTDYEAAYQKLLQQHFDSSEQLRVKALTQ